MSSNDLQFVIPTIVGNNGNKKYNFDKFKIKKIKKKGFGVVATEDFTIQDINKVLIFGGILFNDKQYKRYIKINNNLKFENNLCNSNISHITKANDTTELENYYLIANPILYNDDIKNGWIGSFVNEVSEKSHKIYNAELIVLSQEDLIKYQTQIENLPDCIDKTHIVGICIK